MCNVRLPTDDGEAIAAATARMIRLHSASLPTFSLEGRHYCRVAAQVFSDVDDFVIAARHFRECLKAVSTGGHAET